MTSVATGAGAAQTIQFDPEHCLRMARLLSDQSTAAAMEGDGKTARALEVKAAAWRDKAGQK